jgi:hypothetical protein
MIIQNNKMLPPNSRVIKFYACANISTEGPNIIGKLSLSDVQIPYESQYTTKISLNPGAENQPLLYGFLGNNVTYLLLKATYDETNPRCQIEEEQYIEYYLEDNPTVVRYINKLLLLTGNSQKRIPQIYLNNPGELRVDVEVMMANLGQSDIDIADIQDDTISITNLYHNSIISDTIWNCTTLVSGSTQFQVYDYEGNISLYLDYGEIDTIERYAEDNQLVIDTKSDTRIYLTFLSQFELFQGHSRMEWVLEDPLNRYLTKDHPGIDTIAPVMTMNTGVYPINPSGNTYIMPFSRNPSTSGFTIYPDDVLNYFIYEIEDNRDGKMDVDDADIIIRKEGEILPLTGITETGLFDVIITISDIAKNTTLANYIILVDDIPPVINWKTGIGNTFTIDIPGDLQLPSAGITKDDIIRKTVYNVTDNVNGAIPNSQINLWVNTLSGITQYTPIYTPGQYEIEYTISDEAGNQSQYTKTMIAEGDIITGSGETFTFGPAMTEASFIYTGDSGTTSTIVLSGYTVTIANSGGSFVWDLGGTQQYTFTFPTESISVTYNGTVFDIIWGGYGSLLFSIEKVGPAPDFSNIVLFYQYKESGNSGFVDTDVVEIGDNYIIPLDDDVNSVYNVKIKDVTYNRETFTTTGITLESYTLDNTGTTLYDYYINKYPTYNPTVLTNRLSGTTDFAELFRINDEFIINDLISTDDMESIVIYGNYPKGIYTYRINLIDESGFTNMVKFTIVFS